MPDPYHSLASMGWVKDVTCDIMWVKTDPEEVIIINENSQLSFPEATVKHEPEAVAATETTVNSAGHGNSEFNPVLYNFKEETEEHHGDSIGNNEIKLESLKTEVIDITDDEISGEEDQEMGDEPANEGTDQEEEVTTVTTYNCNTFDEELSSGSSRESHVELRASEKPYKCDKCDYQTDLKNIFRTHMLQHTKEKSYECIYCDFRSPRVSAYREHIFKHTGEKPLKCPRKQVVVVKKFKCRKCNYSSTTKNGLDMHMQNNHNQTLLECSSCRYQTFSTSVLQRHVDIHRSRVKSYSCKACKTRFLYERSLLTHMKSRPCKAGHS